MQIRYVLAALRKHRLVTFLITLQISLSCAVLCNASFLVMQRIESMRIDSGIEEPSLALIKIVGYDQQQAPDLNARMVAALRGVAGVRNVSVVSAVPFGGGGLRAGVHLDPEQKQSAGVIDFYLGDSAAIESFGLRLISGRMPSKDEYTPLTQLFPANPPVLITRKLAAKFWPGKDPIGQQFWVTNTVFRVIGVMEHFSAVYPSIGADDDPDWTVFVPTASGAGLDGKYLIRGNPNEMARIVADARKIAQKTAPNLILDLDASQSLQDLRAEYFEKSNIMLGLLLCLIAGLLGTTALGIIGLANFWVAQRGKQIGIRRALGATKGDILRYFQIENFIIVTLGIALGMLFAYEMNLGLMRYYELPKLPLVYMPIGAVVLWILGQLAVLAPALSASSISPMTAIKSA
ncbi:ABC transporter permease [Massilia sp. CCM 9210]|uniref:ABC transporter permease n=1 Tax=Massilia scottii TaxID=3057166 RepID=UPI002796AFDC|nr:FtsX-like permease family protein [Massilia sp. CCM 9210]MDQ1816193.1 ABC transporter permease [Massilia sp. CCM 9210]